MALTHNIYKSNKLVLRILFSRITTNMLMKNVHNSDSQRNEIIDTLDSFTTQLLQKKSNKWESIRIKRKLNESKPAISVLNHTLINNRVNNDDEEVDIREYSMDKINELIMENIDLVDFKKLQILTNQCIQYKICPSTYVLQKLLSFNAQHGNRDIIKRIQIFIEEIDPDQYELNAKFIHYLAEATWIRGNISDALKLFDQVYENYTFLRRKLKLMIKYMIANVISERSEASLVMVINFTENLALKYDDYFPLACVWQACFLSEWYADQCRAADILDRHEKLCGQIGNRIQFVVSSALKSQQSEVVHRLFELLLKYNMKTHYTYVLQSLFNYRYWQNDLRSCAEIIQWSLNIGISLPTTQQEQFVSLLLNQNSTKIIKNSKSPEHFQYKF